MKQGDSVTIDARDARFIADILRGDGHQLLADLLDPQPKGTDLSAIDYLTQKTLQWERNRGFPVLGKRDYAVFAVETIATWLRAANTNSLAASLILGETP